MKIGFIVGIILAIIVLCVGIIGVLASNYKGEKINGHGARLYLVFAL